MTNKVELLKSVCVDYVRNPQVVQNFSEGKDIDTRIREAFFEILGTDKPTKKQMRNTHNRELVFEVLTEVISETFLKTVEEDEFFMQFADIRNLELGDTNEFYVEDDAVLTVSQHSGNHWNIRRQKLEGGSTFSISTKAYSVGVYADFFAFLSGRVSFERLVNKIAQALRLKIYEEVSATFAASAAQLPTQFQATGVYDQDDLISLYDHVLAATGSSPVIVGTKTALSKITSGGNVQWYSDSMKNELNQTGRVGTYLGMTLVQLPVAHKAGTFDFAYNNDQLLILPTNNDKFIKVVYEGDDLVKQTENEQENTDMSFEYLYLTKFGTNTVFSSLFGVYNLL